jgi:hypothetical protein
MDDYGDGIRSLVFHRDAFPRGQLDALRGLLVGELADFVILCTVLDDWDDRERGRDALAMGRTRTLVTRRLADALSLG